MKFYRIKATLKRVQPAEWYRVLVPSGITFSRLYYILTYLFDDLLLDYPYYIFETRGREIQIEEFVDGEPEFGHRFQDVYDAAWTYIDTFFRKDFRISMYSRDDYELTIDVESDAEEYPDLDAPAVIKVSRAVAGDIGGQYVDDLFKAYTASDLKQIATHEFGLRSVSSMTKANLVSRLTQELAKRDVFEERLTRLDDNEFELFRRCAESEKGVRLRGQDEHAAADELEELFLAAVTTLDKCMIPAELKALFEEVYDDDLELLRQKRLWMFRCLDIAEEYYGVMTWEVLRKLMNKKFKGITSEEVQELFGTVPPYLQPFMEIGDRLVLRGYDEEDYYQYLEKMQGDKPFYIPGAREIEEFSSKGCRMSSPEYQAMRSFFIRKCGLDSSAAELEVNSLYRMINQNMRMQEILDALEDDTLFGENGLVFSSEKDIAEFINLYNEFHNHSHLMINRGYTPIDLFYAVERDKLQREGLPMITPGSREMAEMLKEAAPEIEKRGFRLDYDGIESKLKEEKKVRIGRNDPCPCGSGKKYKNCCGKK